LLPNESNTIKDGRLRPGLIDLCKYGQNSSNTSNQLHEEINLEPLKRQQSLPTAAEEPEDYQISQSDLDRAEETVIW